MVLKIVLAALGATNTFLPQGSLLPEQPEEVMMEFKKIKYEKKDHIVIITLNRPEVHNCLNQETALELHRAWQDFRDDDDAFVAIMTGAGEKAFGAGQNGPVTTIVFNRPEARNACTVNTVKALHDAFMDFEADENAKVAALTGQGDYLCAGAGRFGSGIGRHGRGL